MRIVRCICSSSRRLSNYGENYPISLSLSLIHFLSEFIRPSKWRSVIHHVKIIIFQANGISVAIKNFGTVSKHIPILLCEERRKLVDNLNCSNFVQREIYFISLKFIFFNDDLKSRNAWESEDSSFSRKLQSVSYNYKLYKYLNENENVNSDLLYFIQYDMFFDFIYNKCIHNYLHIQSYQHIHTHTHT